MTIYFILILFFLSLFSIVFMIGRKLAVIKHEQGITEKEIVLEIPYLKNIKHLTFKNIKKHGYTLAVITVRYYVRGTNFLKNKYEKMKVRIMNRGNNKGASGENREISKFLKVVSEYKHKIRRIKHEIKKEESL